MATTGTGASLLAELRANFDALAALLDGLSEDELGQSAGAGRVVGG